MTKKLSRLLTGGTLVFSMLTGKLLLAQTSGPIYLPIVNRAKALAPNPPPGVFGKVLYGGIPAENVSVNIKLWGIPRPLPSSPAFQIISTTFTDSQGRFLFAGIPSVTAPQYYDVQTIANNLVDVVGTWQTHPFSDYIAGTSRDLGEIDISALKQKCPNTPGPTPSLPLPARLEWTIRDTSPGDSYKVFIRQNGATDIHNFVSPNLGRANAYTVTAADLATFEGPSYYISWQVIISNTSGSSMSYSCFVTLQ